MPNPQEIPMSPEAQPEGGDNVEQLLANLSPEELDHLASMLSTDIQHPEAAEGGEDISSLAKAIEAHLGQNPDAGVAEAPPEKLAALNFVKSASYIEGFLTHAVGQGIKVKHAVDMYDTSLAATIDNLKTAALHGGQHKLDVNKDGKITGSDLKSLRHEGKESSKHEKSESKKEEKREHMNEIKEAAYYNGVFERAREYGFSDRQTASFIKAAAEGLENPYAGAQYGSSDPQKYMQIRDSSNSAMESLRKMLPVYGSRPGDEGFVGPLKDTPSLPTIEDAQETARNASTVGEFPPANSSSAAGEGGDAGEGLAEKLKDLLSRGAHSAGGAMHEGLDSLKQQGTQGMHGILDYINANPDAVKNMGLGAAGAGALGLGAYGLHKLMGKKESQPEGMQAKEAAYYEGVFKRAQEYGLSEQQTLQLLKSATRR